MSPSYHDSLVAARDVPRRLGIPTFPVGGDDGKRSQVAHWNDSNRQITDATFRKLLESCDNPGMAMPLGHGSRPICDVECDNDEQRAHLEELLGDDFHKGAAFATPNGEHHLFYTPAALQGLDCATVTLKPSGLMARIGGPGKGRAAYSVMPPSTGRNWLEGRGWDAMSEMPLHLSFAVLEAVPAKVAKADCAGDVDTSPLSAAEMVTAKAAMLEIRDKDTGEIVWSRPGDTGTGLLRASRTAHQYAVDSADVRELVDYFLEHRQAPCPVPWTEVEIRHKISEGRKGAVESGDLGCRRLVGFTTIVDSPILGPTGQAFKRSISDDDEGLGPVITCYADMVKRYPVDLWLGRIGAEDMTLISGDPGVGKSFLTAGIAAVVSTGRNWPDGAECKAGNVGIVNFEDKADTVTIHRLEACGAEMGRVFDCTVTRKRDPRTHEIISSPLVAQELGSIRKFVLSKQLRVLVVDPVGSFLGGNVDSYRDGEVRGVLMPLAQLAQELKFAVVLIAHSTKGSAKNADANVMGSRAFTGVCRTVLHTMLDPTDHDHILLLPGKRNSSKKAPGIGYRIEGEPGVVVWDKDVTNLTTFDILQAEQDQRRPRTAAQQIHAFLDEQLKDGPRSKRSVMLAAIANGFTERSVVSAISYKDVEQYDDDGIEMLRIDENETIVRVRE